MIRKNAGEIGAGHAVTALYEIVRVGRPVPDQPSVDPLKYQTCTSRKDRRGSGDRCDIAGSANGETSLQDSRWRQEQLIEEIGACRRRCGL